MNRHSVTLDDLPQAPTVSRTSAGITSRVLRLLDEQGMTPDDLATMSGIGRVRIQNRLNLQAPWLLNEVEELSRVFDLPWDYWFDE